MTLVQAEHAEQVAALKAEADRHWYIDPARSLALAEQIIQLGHEHQQPAHVALGTMARGDALKFLGRLPEAWDALVAAGDLYQGVGDEVGWARTRIGMLFLAADLQRVEQALVDAGAARAIFVRHGDLERALRLDLNTATLFNRLGDHRRAHALYEAALIVAGALGPAGEAYVGGIHMNLGYSCDATGEFRAALAHYQQARDQFTARGERQGIALVEQNIAHTWIAQGRFREALDTLHHAYDQVASDQPLVAAHVLRDLAEVYLLLNRFAEAGAYAARAADGFAAGGAAYEQAVALVHMATARAELGQLVEARQALAQADQIFARLQAGPWQAAIQLRRAQIALRLGDPAGVRAEAAAARATFTASGQQVNAASAALLVGQADRALGDAAAARQAGAHALAVARRCHVPPLRYAAHMLLGQVAEAAGNERHAERRFRAAAATVDRVQRGLTLTLRPGFLADKGEALRALIALALRQGRVEQAFATLERSRAQTWLGYVANQRQLRWDAADLRSRQLIEDLTRLREEHRWYQRLADESLPRDAERAAGVSIDAARAQLSWREQRMRVLSEQLYLRSASRQRDPVDLPSLTQLRAALTADTLLVSYYHDGATLWAFALTHQALEVIATPLASSELARLLSQVQLNMGAALRAGADAAATRAMIGPQRRVLARLYDLLLRPLEPHLRGCARLTVVPYGALHYLPMHLLHTGARYLIEQLEVTVLPAAALAVRPRQVRPPGARVLAYSRAGQLPHVLAEARAVVACMAGELHTESAAVRQELARPPCQILHIAAHGQQRLDLPDLSYIELADGHIYADDLLQQDLGYELVTLSACETGRAQVAGGDELIGLGRGILYAGAGSLVASMWPVADQSTLAFMVQMYQALRAGQSRAAALRQAQLAMLAGDPDLHPAFWGAFQLVGEPGPLSTS